MCGTEALAEHDVVTDRFSSGGVEARQKIYEESWVKFPKGLVPRRLPLNFLTGKLGRNGLMTLAS